MIFFGVNGSKNVIRFFFCNAEGTLGKCQDNLTTLDQKKERGP